MNKQPWYNMIEKIKFVLNPKVKGVTEEDLYKALRKQFKDLKLHYVNGTLSCGSFNASKTTIEIEELLWTSTEPISEAEFKEALTKALTSLGINVTTLEADFDPTSEPGDPADLM